jgi:hypothetical protein
MTMYESVSQKMPFILAALLLFAIEVVLRRLGEIVMRRRG